MSAKTLRVTQVKKNLLRQSRSCHIHLNTNSHRYTAAIDVSRFFGDGDRVRSVQTQSAVFGRSMYAQKSGAAQFFKNFVSRKLSRFFPFVDSRIYLLVDELKQKRSRRLYHTKILKKAFSRNLNSRQNLNFEFPPNYQ